MNKVAAALPMQQLKYSLKNADLIRALKWFLKSVTAQLTQSTSTDVSNLLIHWKPNIKESYVPTYFSNVISMKEKSMSFQYIFLDIILMDNTFMPLRSFFFNIIMMNEKHTSFQHLFLMQSWWEKNRRDIDAVFECIFKRQNIL